MADQDTSAAAAADVAPGAMLAIKVKQLNGQDIPLTVAANVSASAGHGHPLGREGC